MNEKNIIVGISGASGACYGIRLLELLQPLDIKTHLIISKSAALTIHSETNLSLKQVRDLADISYDPMDVGAAISSGSFPTLGMIIAPCSMKTLAEIASGMSSTLMGRAADVVLKERRKLVLLPRETPLHAIHLQNMLTVTNAGGIMAPPVPAYYNRPTSLDDIINHTCQRVLDLYDIQAHELERWNGMGDKAS